MNHCFSRSKMVRHWFSLIDIYNSMNNIYNIVKITT